MNAAPWSRAGPSSPHPAESACAARLARVCGPRTRPSLQGPVFLSSAWARSWAQKGPGVSLRSHCWCVAEPGPSARWSPVPGFLLGHPDPSPASHGCWGEYLWVRGPTWMLASLPSASPGLGHMGSWRMPPSGGDHRPPAGQLPQSPAPTRAPAEPGREPQTPPGWWALWLGPPGIGGPGPPSGDPCRHGLPCSWPCHPPPAPPTLGTSPAAEKGLHSLLPGPTC